MTALDITKLKDSQIADNIRRYRDAKLTKGGPYSLSELLAEQHDRQKAGAFATLDTARAIVRLSKASADGLVTYGDIWAAFRPDAPWHVFNSRREVTNALERVQHYCIRQRLLLLATLVVNAGDRKLTDDAKANITTWARENGVDVGVDADAFITQQQIAARTVTYVAVDNDG